MKTIFLAASVALSGAALAGGFGTKYVLVGWDISRATPEQILARANQLDELPVDGVSVGVSARQDGALLTAGYIWNDPAWRFESFAKYPPLFRELVKHRSLRETFLGCGMSARPKTNEGYASAAGKNPRLSLDDDASWARVANNYGVLARIAKEGGLKGVLIDNEDYCGTGQFQLKPEDGDWESANVKMRARGRQVFKAVFDAYPDVKLLFFWAFSNARGAVMEKDPPAALKNQGRLLVAFLNGMLDVMPPEATFIDGDEDAYTFRAADGTFERTYCQMLSDVLVFVAPENRAKYRAQVRNSFGLYLDQYVGAKYRKRAGKRGVPNNWYRAPVNGSRDQAFFEDLAAATRAADEHVWIYGEHFSFIDWGHDIDDKMRPWNTMKARETWEEQLGLSTKLRLVKEPDRLLAEELPRLKGDPKADNIFARAKRGNFPSVTVFDSKEQITNRNHFIVTVEVRNDTRAPVLRWRKGLNWNWEPSGVRKNELKPMGPADAEGWTTFAALVRVPVDADNCELQIASKLEVRNAGLYRVDPPPVRPYQRACQLDLSKKTPTLAALSTCVERLAARGYTQLHLVGAKVPFAKDLAAVARAKGLELVLGEVTDGVEGRHVNLTDIAAEQASDKPPYGYIDRIFGKFGPARLAQRDAFLPADVIVKSPELIREIDKSFVLIVDGDQSVARFEQVCATLKAEEVRFVVSFASSAAGLAEERKARAALGRKYGSEGELVRMSGL